MTFICIPCHLSLIVRTLKVRILAAEQVVKVLLTGAKEHRCHVHPILPHRHHYRINPYRGTTCLGEEIKQQKDGTVLHKLPLKGS